MLSLDTITELRQNFWMLQIILGCKYINDKIGYREACTLTGADFEYLLHNSDVMFYVPQNMKGYILSTIRGQWSEYGPPFDVIHVYDAVQQYPLAVLEKAVEKCIAKVPVNE